MIVRSLRVRLLIAIATIVGAVLLAVGFFSSFTVKREFDRFLVRQSAEHETRAVQRLESFYAQQKSWDGAESVLAEIHTTVPARMILADRDRKVVARVPDEMKRYGIVIGPADELMMSLPPPRQERIELRGGGRPLRAADGSRVGTLFILPPQPPDARAVPPAAPELRLRRSFRGSLDRWLLVVIAAATLLALIVTLLTLRRIFAPVEALTAGVRSLAGGRLDTRVPARGDDEIAELARSFNAMAEALERNERARRNMVSDVAHELRTPLTNIRVQIEAAQDGVVEADERLFASIAEDAATLSRLIDDLQQLSLAEAGQLKLEVAEVGVKELVTRALSGAPPPSAAHQPQIQIQIPDDLAVRADARRVVQVIRNLVVNALAYAASSIEISAAREGERIAIRVADDGPGIAPEHIDRIFDRFYRADASRSRTTGGAGLGLAIAKELVELHGGTIRVSNRPSGGAEFVFTL